MSLASISPGTASLLLWIFKGRLIWVAQSHFSRISSSDLYIDTRVYKLAVHLPITEDAFEALCDALSVLLGPFRVRRRPG